MSRYRMARVSQRARARSTRLIAIPRSRGSVERTRTQYARLPVALATTPGTGRVASALVIVGRTSMRGPPAEGTRVLTVRAAIALATVPGGLLALALPPGRHRWAAWASAPALSLGLTA